MNKKEIQKNTKYSKLLIILVLSIIIYLILNFKSVFSSIENSINICLYIVVPSLFSFMIISNFIMLTSLSNYMFSVFNPVAKYIFKVNSQYTYIIILSMIGGYPVGAKLISESVKRNEMDIKTAQRMIMFCVNSGPAFIFGTVAIPIFNSPKIGVIIFISNIISSMIIGIIVSKNKIIPSTEYSDKVQQKKHSYIEALILSTNISAKALFNISSLIILFSVITNILTNENILNFISNISNNILNQSIIKNLVMSLLEVTAGIINIPNLPNTINPILVSSAITSFGGICIIFQIISITKIINLNIKKFILFRGLYTIINIFTTYILTLSFSVNTLSKNNTDLPYPVISSNSHIVSVLIISLSIMLIYSIKYKK